MGADIFVRPIRPEYAPLLVELFDSMSPRSVYFRFFTPLKRLPHSMLARFTQIDYDREIALVAISESEGRERILGVARVITGRNPKQAEFAVAIGAPWQGNGIGATLLVVTTGIPRPAGTVGTVDCIEFDQVQAAELHQITQLFQRLPTLRLRHRRHAVV